jgi:hypothetical protein
MGSSLINNTGGIYSVYPITYRVYSMKKIKDEMLSSPDLKKPWAKAGNWAIVNPIGRDTYSGFLQGRKTGNEAGRGAESHATPGKSGRIWNRVPIPAEIRTE